MARPDETFRLKPATGRLRRWLRGEGGRLLVVVALLLVARTSFANHYAVPSGSMEYALMPGDHVAVDMSAYGLRLPFTDIVLLARDQPRRGDVAVFDSPRDGTRLVKRVAAVGGDLVELRNGHLSINGQPLAGDAGAARERFGARTVALNLDAGGGPDIDHFIVPRGQVLMLGDHRGNSADGRFYGLVHASGLYGKASHVYYRRGEGLTWQAL
jgi:signal peptidase I